MIDVKLAKMFGLFFSEFFPLNNFDVSIFSYVGTSLSFVAPIYFPCLLLDSDNFHLRKYLSLYGLKLLFLLPFLFFYSFVPLFFLFSNNKTITHRLLWRHNNMLRTSYSLHYLSLMVHTSRPFLLLPSKSPFSFSLYVVIFWRTHNVTIVVSKERAKWNNESFIRREWKENSTRKKKMR